MTSVLNLLPLLNGNKLMHMKIKTITPLFIIFFFFNQYILSQKYYPVVKKNGDFFHEINIYQGLTLYSLSQKINCSTDDIIKHNPGASAGLNLGEKIYFPLTRKTLRHKVSPKESLYSLSQDYLIPIDSIISWNLGSKSGIQIGNELVIKNGAVRLLSESSSKTIESESNQDNSIINKDDKLINHVVVQGESIYGIAKRYMVSSDKICQLNGINPNQIKVGSVLKIPLKSTIDLSQNEKSVPLVDKGIDSLIKPIENPKIAIFLPFGADTIKSLKSVPHIIPTLNLYVGISLGIQDFAKKFKSAEITYYDYHSPKVDLDSVLLSENMASMNLVYASVLKADAVKISDYCKAHQIPVIIPLEFESPSIQSNPFAYQLPLSKRSEALVIANRLQSLQAGHQIVLVRSISKEAFEIEEAFLSAYQSFSGSPGYSKVIEIDTNGFKNVVNSVLPTYYVSFVRQPAEVKAILKRSKTLGNSLVFGSSSWTKIRELKNNYSFIYAEACGPMESGSERMNSLYIKSRDRYHIMVNKTICRGYDFINLLPKLILLNEAEAKGFIYNVKFNQKDLESYHENTLGYLYKFIKGNENDPIFIK